MTMHYCPGCMKLRLEFQKKCFYCGFSIDEYQLPKTALPIGTELNHYLIGAMLGNNRQAQVYCALNRDLEMPVLVEEFFPFTVAGRRGNSPMVINVPNTSNYTKARDMYLASTAERPLKLLDSFTANNTAYRVYELSSLLSSEEQSTQLTAAPIFFRGIGGKPLMTINGLDIPPMPTKRSYRKNPKKTVKGKLVAFSLGAIAVWGCAALFIFPRLQDITGGKFSIAAEPSPTAIVEITQAPTGDPTAEPTTIPSDVPTIQPVSKLDFLHDVIDENGYLKVLDQYEIQGVAHPNAQVTVTVNGQTLRLATDEAGRFTFTLQPEVLIKDNENTIEVRCEAAPMQGVATQKLHFLYKPEIASINLALPPVEGECILEGTVERNAEVTLLVNNDNHAIVTCSSEGTFAFPALILRAGDTVQLQATDSAGNISRTQQYIIPYQAIQLDSSGDMKKLDSGFVQTRPTYMIEGSASPDTLIQLYLNGKPYGDAVQCVNGLFNKEIKSDDLLPENVLYATYVDEPNQASEDYSFYYRTSELLLTVDKNNLYVGVRNITGHAEAGCLVTLQVGKLTQSVIASENHRFVFENVPLAENDTVSITVKDEAENRKSISQPVAKPHLTINNLPEVMGGESATISGSAKGLNRLYCIIRHSNTQETVQRTEVSIDGEGWEVIVDLDKLTHNLLYEFVISDAPMGETSQFHCSGMFTADLLCEFNNEAVNVKNETAKIIGHAPESSVVLVNDEQNNLILSCPVVNGQYLFDLPLLDNAQVLHLKAEDAIGNVGSLRVTVQEKERTKIEVNLDPLHTFGAGQATITGIASANKELELLIDGHEVLCRTVADKQGAWRMVFEVGAGRTSSTLLIRYVADQPDQYSSKSAEIKVIFDTSCNLDYLPDAIYADTLVLSGETDAHALVQVLCDGETIGEMTADSTGKFIFDTLSAHAGDSLILKATDAVGNESKEKVITIKAARNPYMACINTENATIDLSAEDPAYLLNPSAWLFGTAACQPKMELYLNGELLEEIPLQQITEDALQQQAQDYGISNDKVIIQSGWTTATETESRSLTACGEYELRLSVKETDADFTTAASVRLILREKAQATFRPEATSSPTVVPETTLTPNAEATAFPTPSATPTDLTTAKIATEETPAQETVSTASDLSESVNWHTYVRVVVKEDGGTLKLGKDRIHLAPGTIVFLSENTDPGNFTKKRLEVIYNGEAGFIEPEDVDLYIRVTDSRDVYDQIGSTIIRGKEYKLLSAHMGNHDMVYFHIEYAPGDERNILFTYCDTWEED